jgi:uncharacterized DUF497 family protein
MNFSWDPKKAKANLEKHKVSFDEAVTTFYDPLAKVGHDPDHSDEEDRYILIGHSQKSHLLFVVHVYRDESENIRIISARKATKKEMKDFQEL